MKRLQLTFAALATLLIGSALWSCDKDKTPTELDATRSAQTQPSPPTMPSGGMPSDGMPSGGMPNDGMPGTADGMMDQIRTGCPMVVQEAEVTVADTDEGVALTFTTDAGDVADLRTRVRSMAKLYDMHRGQGGMMWHHMGGEGMGHSGRGMGGEGMGHGGRGMGGEGMGRMDGRGPMPAASITVSDTDKGARLEFRPTDPSQLDTLREHVRRHQQRMHSGECWMQQGQPTATPRGEQE